jgi:hypothetical protein
MDNLKEAGQRIRATQSLMRSQSMTDSEDWTEIALQRDWNDRRAPSTLAAGDEAPMNLAKMARSMYQMYLSTMLE